MHSGNFGLVKNAIPRQVLINAPALNIAATNADVRRTAAMAPWIGTNSAANQV
jgi:hypothetical protein